MFEARQLLELKLNGKILGSFEAHDIADLRRACDRLLASGPFRAPVETLAFIQEKAACAFGYSLQQVLSRVRTQRLAWARQVGMSLCVELGGGSQSEVARLYRRDHGTVRHALRSVHNGSLYPGLKSEAAGARDYVRGCLMVRRQTSNEKAH